jgi:methionyl-tRNA formyltransferase
MPRRNLDIIYVGHNISVLESLINEDRIHIKGVIVEDDKANSNIQNIAESKNMLFHRVRNDDELDDAIAENGSFDVMLVSGFGYILKERMLQHASVANINIHYSYLPFYKGRHPVRRVLMNVERRTGITAHVIDKSIDTGPIVSRISIDIDRKENYLSLCGKMEKYIPKVIGDIVEYCLKPEELVFIDNEGGTYYPPVDYERECRIDWSEDVEKIAFLIRSQYGGRGAYTECDAKRLYVSAVDDVKVRNGRNNMKSFKNSGEVVCIKGKTVSIVCGDARVVDVVFSGDGLKLIRVGSVLG